MSRVLTLDQLLSRLQDCQGQDYVHLAEQLDLLPSQFTSYQFWNQDHYTRNCIVRNADYELILLCWDKNQKTPIHCHGGEECWVYMLDGTISESRYIENAERGLKETSCEEVSNSNLSYMTDDMGFHSLTNIGEGTAMSLHLYVKPITKCRVYDESKMMFIERKMSDYSFEGKLLKEEVAFS